MAAKTKTPDATPKEPTEAELRGKALWATMQAAIDAQIGDDRKHGWGNDDSFAVIEAIVAEDASQSKVGDVTKFTLSDEASAMIKIMINPSAFRQQEEKEGGRLDKNETKRTSSLDALKKQFGG